MSDNDPNNTASGAKDPGSVQGKGWDILTGGRDNSAAAGGSDPFDLLKPPLSASPAPAQTADVEADAVLKSKLPPQGAAMPADAALDQGRGPSAPGAATPRALSPQDMKASTPGVSPGVVVTPVAPAAPGGIIEIGGPAVPPSASSAPAPAPTVPGPRLMPAPMTTTPVPRPPMPPGPGFAGPGISGPLLTPQGISGGMDFAGGYVSAYDPTQTSHDVQIVASGAKDLPPDPQQEALLVTQDRVDQLWASINATYDQVVNDVRGHFNTSAEAINDLRKARELMMAGKDNYDNAEELVEAVKARLRLEEKVRQWARTRGAWLAAYLVLWLIILALGSFATNSVKAYGTTFVPDWMVDTWLPALTGALGGVIGALWVLNKHITRSRDFDPIHTMWYVTNPFMGAALGVVTYFIVRGGGWLLINGASGNGKFELTPPLALTLYALCIIVGYNQNILWTLMDRFVAALFPPRESEAKAATDAEVEEMSAAGGTTPAKPAAPVPAPGAPPTKTGG